MNHKTEMTGMLRRLRPSKDGRSGQVLMFLVMAVVIITFAALWNFDMHKALFVKATSQNGGDAGALMAARWQGITLNLIGDLNIMQALALSTAADDVDETAAAINDVQARLLYSGPMIAFEASQQAAKNNGIFVNEGFTRYIREHATIVRDDYPARTTPGGEMLFPEPYPDAWAEYSDMLFLVADNGVAAGPDNMRLYTDGGGDHILMNIEFYEAIASRNWCWFFRGLGERTLLDDYVNFFPCWWPALPGAPRRYFINCEFFSLGLTMRTTTLDRFIEDIDYVEDLAATRELDGSMAPTGMTTRATWYCYGGGFWGDWHAMSTEGDWPMPLTGNVRPQYYYTGADAAVRVETEWDRVTPGHLGRQLTNTMSWSSAAKPFGYLEDGDEDRRPDSLTVALPAFHDVRLIPIDASSAPSGGSFNLAWREHIDHHLPTYMESGPYALPSCWYCNQLRTWENPAFRAEGSAWLATYGERCIPRGGGGGGGGGRRGGRRRGH